MNTINLSTLCGYSSTNRYYYMYVHVRVCNRISSCQECSWHEHVVCGVAEQSTSPCVCVSCDAKVLIVHKYTQELNTQLQQ